MMHRLPVAGLFLLLTACGGGPSLDGTYLGDPAPARDVLAGPAARIAAGTSGEIVDVSLVVKGDAAHLLVRAADGENVDSFAAVPDGAALDVDPGAGASLRFVLQEGGDLECTGCGALGLPSKWYRQR
ncbi:MAG: hypothetical protein PHF72_08520 [Gammaproteobacteria bacterium]|nr:hypothetical protein [Gammaproteobacteria bacterium]